MNQRVYLQKGLRWSIRMVAAILLFIAGYLLCAVILSVIPINPTGVTTKNERTLYILSNGVHTDLVLPMRTPEKDWSTRVQPGLTAAADTAAQYVAFGWGDKGFYLETPTWADLKASTAFKAMFALGASAMHVTFHRNLQTGVNCRAVTISPTNYRKLIAYIENSFQRTTEGSFIPIPGHSYSTNDLFYEATGSYSMLCTCNTWANAGLKSGNLRACLWTPFDKGILYQYADH